jgi:hypothetical protein
VGGSEHDDSWYSKLSNLKQAAEETKQTLGIPVGATYTATILEFFGGFVSDNRPNCSDSWIVFCYFDDCKCDYKENKDECSIHCSWQGFVRNLHNLSDSLNNTDRSRSWRIISRLGYWFLVRPIFRSVYPGHKMLVGSNTTQNSYQLNS